MRALEKLIPLGIGKRIIRQSWDTRKSIRAPDF